MSVSAAKFIDGPVLQLILFSGAQNIMNCSVNILYLEGIGRSDSSFTIRRSHSRTCWVSFQNTLHLVWKHFTTLHKSVSGGKITVETLSFDGIGILQYRHSQSSTVYVIFIAFAPTYSTVFHSNVS